MRGYCGNVAMAKKFVRVGCEVSVGMIMDDKHDLVLSVRLDTFV